MNRIKNSLLAASALIIIALAISHTSIGTAIAQAIQDVRVVNNSEAPVRALIVNAPDQPLRTNSVVANNPTMPIYTRELRATWEYKSVSGANADILVSQLNSEGSAGWELVGFFTSRDNRGAPAWIAILKRAR